MATSSSGSSRSQSTNRADEVLLGLSNTLKEKAEELKRLVEEGSTSDSTVDEETSSQGKTASTITLNE